MSASIALPILPSPLAVCRVLLVGNILVQHVPVLTRYRILAPIVSGLIFSFLAVKRLWQ